LNVTGYPLHLETGAETEETASVRTIQWISQHPKLRGVPVVVIIEAAPAIQSSYIIGHMNAAAAKFGVSLIYMAEAHNKGNKRIYGITKDKKLQEAYRFNLIIVLRNRLLAYDPDVDTLVAGRSALAEVDRLAKMMSYYHYDEKKKAITSKGLGKDDILAALVQMLYFGQIFWTDSYYVKQQKFILEKCGMEWFPFPGSGATVVDNLPTGGKRKISQM
jgi:hypothetical protein